MLWVFRHYCHRKDRRRSLQRERRIELFLLTPVSEGKLFQLSRLIDLVRVFFYQPYLYDFYDFKRLLKKGLSLLFLFVMSLFDDLIAQIETCGRFFTKNLLTSGPPCPSKTPNSADFGQFSRKQSYMKDSRWYLKYHLPYISDEISWASRNWQTFWKQCLSAISLCLSYHAAYSSL